MSNDDFSRSHLSNGLMARFRPERIGGNSDLILTITKHAGPVSVRTEKLCGDPRTSHIPRQMQLITVGELRKDWTNWPRLGRDATDAQCPARHNNSRLWHNPGILMRSPSTSVISQTATRLHNPHCSSLVRGAPQKCIRETAGNCR